jgi:hypothetical protein
MSEREIFAKCAWRLIPLIMVLYVVNYVDRVNVGFAALTMNADLGFSRAAGEFLAMNAGRIGSPPPFGFPDPVGMMGLQAFEACRAS